MKYIKYSKPRLFAIILFLFLLSYGSWFFDRAGNDFSIAKTTTRTFNLNDVDDYTVNYKGDFFSYGKVKLVKLFYTGCLKSILINGKTITEEKFFKLIRNKAFVDSSCLSSVSYQQVVVNLAPYFVNGENFILVKMKPSNEEGDEKLSEDIRISLVRETNNYLLFYRAVLCIFAFALLLLCFELPFNVNVIIILSFITSVLFLVKTGEYAFSPDFYSIKSYFYYIHSHLKAPMPNSGFIYYHQPLYYFLGLPFFTLGEMVRVDGGFELLRIFSMILYFFSLIILSKIICLMFSEKKYQSLTILLLCFTILGTMISVRVNSDILVYFFTICSFYYTYNFYQETYRIQLFISALLFSVLATLSKINGLISFAVLSAVLMVVWLQKKVSFKKLLKNKLLYFSLFLLFGAVTLNITRTQVDSNIDNFSAVGNEGAMMEIAMLFDRKLDNDISNYLTIDLSNFNKYLFYSDLSSDSDWGNFWTYFFKSTQFGKFVFSHEKLSYFIQYLFLTIFIFNFAATLYFWRKKECLKYFPVLSLFVLGIVASLYNRITVPFIMSGDIRYVYFVYSMMMFLFVINLKLIEESHYKKTAMYYQISLCLYSVVSFLIIFLN